MISVYDNGTQAKLGEITQEQLQFLVDQLEETSLEDQDYYVDANTLAMLTEAGADAELLELLKSGMGDRDGYEIRWSRE
ncbi:MAG: galactosyldiacylglycerol synthase [Gemmatimonadota bacterium]|nr:MAG: galactosyldiacylglycerol synthase [Gemmatimonadota bacterium]